MSDTDAHMADAGTADPAQENEIELIAAEEVAQEFDIGEAPKGSGRQHRVALTMQALQLTDCTSLLRR